MTWGLWSVGVSVGEVRVFLRVFTVFGIFLRVVFISWIVFLEGTSFIVRFRFGRLGIMGVCVVRLFV